MNRTIATGIVAALGCAGLALTGCETGYSSGRSYSVPTAGPAQARQVPPRLVSAPEGLKENPAWILIDPVRVESSVRFEEFDPKMSEKALSEYFRREIRDQVVATEHFRVFGDFGEKSPQPPKYVIRGTLRRLDVGAEFDADPRTGGPVGEFTGKAEQVQTVRPVTCELRLEMLATDKVDPRVGMPGETVAIGDAEVGFNVSTKFTIVTTEPGATKDAKPETTVKTMEAFKIQREQIPGSLLRTVRLALNDLLLNANDPVFQRERKLVEADRKAEEERTRQAQKSEEERKRQAQRLEEERQRIEREAKQAGVSTETGK